MSKQVTVTFPNGVVHTYTPVMCQGCKTEQDPLRMFPKDLCLDCYRNTADAHRPISARELAQMWGAK